MAHPKNLTSSVCFALTILSLVALAVLPERFVKREFTFQETASTHPERFPLNGSYKVLWAPAGSGLKTGSSVKLSELVGDRGAIVNFWATWCSPCIEEIPSLDYLGRQLRGSHYPTMIAVSVDEEASEVPKLFNTMKLSPSFVVLHDPDGQLSRTVGTVKFPETYWVTKDGSIRHQWIGPQNWLGQSVIGRLTQRLE